MSQKYSIKMDNCFRNLFMSTTKNNFCKNDIQLAHIISDFRSKVSDNTNIYSCKILILPDSLEVEFIENNSTNNINCDAHSTVLYIA